LYLLVKVNYNSSNLCYVPLTNFDMIGIKCSTRKQFLSLMFLLWRIPNWNKKNAFWCLTEVADRWENRKKCTQKSVLKNVSWHLPSVSSYILLVMTILIYVIRHCHFELVTSWILFACFCVLVFKHAPWWIKPCWNDVSVICTQDHISSAVTCTWILNRSIFLKTFSLLLLLTL
jgi:hypothetical protein